MPLDADKAGALGRLETSKRSSDHADQSPRNQRHCEEPPRIRGAPNDRQVGARDARRDAQAEEPSPGIAGDRVLGAVEPVGQHPIRGRRDGAHRSRIGRQAFEAQATRLRDQASMRLVGAPDVGSQPLGIFVAGVVRVATVHAVAAAGHIEGADAAIQRYEVGQVVVAAQPKGRLGHG